MPMSERAKEGNRRRVAECRRRQAIRTSRVRFAATRVADAVGDGQPPRGTTSATWAAAVIDAANALIAVLRPDVPDEASVGGPAPMIEEAFNAAAAAPSGQPPLPGALLADALARVQRGSVIAAAEQAAVERVDEDAAAEQYLPSSPMVPTFDEFAAATLAESLASVGPADELWDLLTSA